MGSVDPHVVIHVQVDVGKRRPHLRLLFAEGHMVRLFTARLNLLDQILGHTDDVALLKVFITHVVAAIETVVVVLEINDGVTNFLQE